MAQVQLPLVEPAILASVVVLGLLVALAVNLPIWLGALVIGVSALFHGHAHGAEAASHGGSAYMIGFIATTAALHLAGIGAVLGLRTASLQPLVRVAGAACALIGVGPRPQRHLRSQSMIPGEMFIKDGEIVLNEGRKTVTLTVANTGDRPIQVGSHYHFFETNPALKFDRKKARGMRLNIAAGTAVRFEPGQTRDVTLVALAGKRTVYGFRGDVMGKL